MELQSRMGRTESELHRARQEVSHYKNSEARYSKVTIWKPDIQILDIRMPDIVGVWYLNGKVEWLGRPFVFRTFWTTNRLFQSGVQTTTRTLNHLTTLLVRYTDGYCTRGTFINYIVQISTFLWPPMSHLFPVSPVPVLTCVWTVSDFFKLAIVKYNYTIAYTNDHTMACKIYYKRVV